MKVLVTGISGFIGFFTAKKLIEIGYNIVGIDNINDYYDTNLKYSRLKELGFDNGFIYNEIKKSNKYDNLSFYKLNIEDFENLDIIFKKEKFDYVINLAAQAGVRYSIENPFSYINSNVNGFQSLIECSVKYNIKHFIYASSSSVYGKNPKYPFCETDVLYGQESFYAVTKKFNEDTAFTYNKLYGINCTGLRFFTVYGAYSRPDMAPFIFTKSILEGTPINLFNNGFMFRDFTYIQDIIDGIVLIINNIKGNEIYNIGSGAPVSLIEFVNLIEDEVGVVSKKIMKPIQKGDVEKTFADISKIKKLGYSPKTTIEEGISIFVNWFKMYYDKS